MEKEERMLNGNLFKSILLFSIPLMFSNLLQVVFNITDLAVVGQTSAIALGAVGSTVMLVSLYIGLLLGLGNGVNVFVARYLGSGEDEKVKRTVNTGFYITIVFGVVLTAVAIGTAYPILLLLQTKPELINDAFIYLAIYFISLPGVAIYNWGNGALSASGDTKRPLIFLGIAGILNLVLNLIMVLIFNMGVVGVAIASVVSQYLSAICILITMMHDKGKHRLVLKGIKPSMASAKEILGVGLPSGIQYGIFAVANMFIQSGINSFDHVTVEGISAATNADSFIYEPMYAFYTACASFMSKNYGAGKKDRIIKSYFISMLYSFLLGLILGGLLFLFGSLFLRIFTNDQAVIDAGLLRIKVMGFSYCVSAFMDCTTAACRGLGKTLIPTCMVISGTCIFRIVWIFTVFQAWHTVECLFLVYVITWVITSTAEIIYFTYTYRKQISTLSLA